MAITKRNLSQLLAAVQKSKKAALLTGAGVSASNGIPPGNKLATDFGRAHRDLLKKHGIHDVPEDRKEEGYIRKLAVVLQYDRNTQNAMLDWLGAVEGMEGKPSNHHAIFALAWFQGVFRHLITTNWDFLFEWQINELYEAAHSSEEIMEPVPYKLPSGEIYSILPDRLFELEPLDGDDLARNPRYEIISDGKTLEGITRYTKPIWKIHGSPFFLYCPKCGGMGRWQLVELKAGDRCPHHPDMTLEPEIVYWNYGIDHSYPAVWQRLRARLKRCDLVLVVGFSGGDAYIRKELETHKNLWIAGLSPDWWDSDNVNFVHTSAQALAAGLISIIDDTRKPYGAWYWQPPQQ